MPDSEILLPKTSSQPARGRSKPRFHCGTCGNPVAPGEWIRMAYGYRDGERVFLACPSCLATQHLLKPVAASPRTRPPSRRTP